MLFSIVRMLMTPHCKPTDDLSPKFHREVKQCEKGTSGHVEGLCVIGCENNLEEEKEELQPRQWSNKRNLRLQHGI